MKEAAEYPFTASPARIAVKRIPPDRRRAIPDSAQFIFTSAVTAAGAGTRSLCASVRCYEGNRAAMHGFYVVRFPAGSRSKSFCYG